MGRRQMNDATPGRALGKGRAEVEAGTEQILLVDDNPINLQILQQSLQGCDYGLLLARDGREALEVARRERPSLVLLDVMMPIMDGFEVCRRLKASSQTADIAVIFLSALGESADKVRGFALGGVDYIAKPFRPDEVVARVKTHVKIHRLERELARRNSELEAENQRILHTISEGIVGLDGQGRITACNPAASRMLGWPVHDVLGERLHGLGLFAIEDGIEVEEDQTTVWRCYAAGEGAANAVELIRRRDGRLIHVAMTASPLPEDGAGERVRDLGLCATGEGIEVEEDQTTVWRGYAAGAGAANAVELIRRRDGRLIHVAMTATPLPGGGAVLVLRDISQWKESEEALRVAREQLESQRQHLAHMERLSTLGEMGAGIAHEVNQPLTAVTNYARVARRLLREPELDRQRLDHVLSRLDVQAVRAEIGRASCRERGGSAVV